MNILIFVEEREGKIDSCSNGDIISK